MNKLNYILPLLLLSSFVINAMETNEPLKLWMHVSLLNAQSKSAFYSQDLSYVINDDGTVQEQKTDIEATHKPSNNPMPEVGAMGVENFHWVKTEGERIAADIKRITYQPSVKVVSVDTGDRGKTTVKYSIAKVLDGVSTLLQKAKTTQLPTYSNEKHVEQIACEGEEPFSIQFKTTISK